MIGTRVRAMVSSESAFIPYTLQALRYYGRRGVNGSHRTSSGWFHRRRVSDESWITTRRTGRQHHHHGGSEITSLSEIFNDLTLLTKLTTPGSSDGTESLDPCFTDYSYAGLGGADMHYVLF